jgi:hypothetical protein
MPIAKPRRILAEPVPIVAMLNASNALDEELWKDVVEAAYDDAKLKELDDLPEKKVLARLVRMCSD